MGCEEALGRGLRLEALLLSLSAARCTICGALWTTRASVLESLATALSNQTAVAAPSGRDSLCVL